MMATPYEEFLLAKASVAPRFGGLEVDEADLNPALMPHVRRKVAWAIRGGRRAWFASFGLGKTTTQIETLRVIGKLTGRPTLIVAPLGVRREFIEQAKQYFTGDFSVQMRFIRSSAEVDGPGIYLTNYESVREGKVRPEPFVAVSLDEAAILRGFGGTKTFREFMALFAGDDRRDKSQTIRTEGVQFRFVATATPSPNDYIELLSYAAFLDVMDVSAAKTRFFKRDSEKADNLTLMPHMAEEFWLWVASWALFVTKPSDLDPAFQDAGYDMPPLDIRWHEIPTDHLKHAGVEKSGQMRMFADAAADLSGVAKEKRDSLPRRIEKLMQLRAENLEAHRLIWHDLEAERDALERAIPSMATVYGSQDLEEREKIIGDFADGHIAELGAKPVMLGSGTNLQRHCNWAIFLGIGFKFNDFIQAVHRLRRFGQPHTVRLDLIYTEAERGIRRALERKWKQHNDMVEKMTDIIRQYGLSEKAMAEHLTRAMGVDRIEKSGENFRVVLNDTIKETAAMEPNSVQLIVTSIPFSTQYEYSPNYADFGHTDNDAHFWQQMDYLIPSLLNVLEPGRICAIHVKDRIIPGGINGFGFQTLSTLHMDCVYRFKSHGFAYLGMKTITTDVVRENNQTYRLGWTEQCKDGSRMGVGVPEYLLIFRKPPSDNSNGYADRPVAKAKKEWDPDAKNWRNEGGYSRARWQLDAHGYAKSSGNRVLTPEDLNGLDASQVYKLWRQYGQNTVYDYEHHVKIGEALEMQGRLPPTFMLLQPHTLHPDVWTDVARMMTLNSTQAAKGKEQHLCPLQFDIVDRAIVQYTEPGEWVYDPFGGIGTVPYRALKLGRKGACTELSPIYWIDACHHVEAAANDTSTASLFDLIDMEEGEEVAV
jgi:hypothetical protein